MQRLKLAFLTVVLSGVTAIHIGRVSAAIITSPSDLSPGTTLLDFESLPVSPLSNPTTFGTVTFSSTIGLGIDDVSPFCTSCTEVFRNVLLPRTSIFGGNYGVLTMSFATSVSEVGFGIWDANLVGNTVSAFDVSSNLLESVVITDLGPPGGTDDTFIGFKRASADIKRVVYTPISPGDFYGIDNLRFLGEPIPEPGSIAVWAISALIGNLWVARHIRHRCGSRSALCS